MEKINIKEILEKEGVVRKFAGVAPEGFILVHEKTLEKLKDMDTWIDWKMKRISINELNKLFFEYN